MRGTPGPVVDGRACDVRFAGDGQAGRAALERLFSSALEPIADVIVQIEAHRRPRLLVADMDSTMITVECIDELADYVGLKDEVSAVTEAAMRGEIDFAQALHSRVKLLAGLSEAIVAECLRDRVKITGGAIELVTAFRAAGGRAVLVSGGFTHFTDSVARMIGFDRAVANRLVVRHGELTGEVEAPIVDAAAKRAILLSYTEGDGSRHDGFPAVSITSTGPSRSAGPAIPRRQTLAIGDGANDIPMIEAAGLGIAYHAKPLTCTAADACVRVGDLSVLRYALGLI